MNPYVGIWNLQSAASTDSEVELVEPRFDAEFECLSVSAMDLLETASPAEGLTIEITDAMEFTQKVSGTPAVMCYDVEGVWHRSIMPFDGKCFAPQPDGRLYLISNDRPNWATPKEEAKLLYFRYDDSDTVICDFVELHNQDLLRTVNVLTDGQYLDHILMKFARDNSPLG